MDKSRVTVGKTFEGKVVRTGKDKTIVVEVSRVWRHPIYRKALRRTRRFLVHSEIADISVGDKVVITETKPMSRRKHFITRERKSRA